LFLYVFARFVQTVAHILAYHPDVLGVDYRVNINIGTCTWANFEGTVSTSNLMVNWKNVIILNSRLKHR